MVAPKRQVLSPFYRQGNQGSLYWAGYLISGLSFFTCKTKNFKLGREKHQFPQSDSEIWSEQPSGENVPSSRVNSNTHFPTEYLAVINLGLRRAPGVQWNTDKNERHERMDRWHNTTGPTATDSPSWWLIPWDVDFLLFVPISEYLISGVRMAFF